MSRLDSLTPHEALWLSVAAALVTIALKWTAYWVTGSVAFLSDALESLVNLAGATFALVMVLYARQPADPGHPFGHGKAEYFASAFEGVLIAVAAVAIMVAAVQRILEPQPLEALGLGTAFSVAASVVNLVVARILLRVGKAHRSLATQADGRHLMTDVWTTVGVVVGVGAAGLTGWYVLDPLVAIAVAANILREGYRLVRRSIDGLMDAALGDAEIRAIEEALERLGRQEARFANLRTRRAGANRFAQVELRVPEDWRVGRAHRLAVAAEQALAGQAVTLKVQVIPENGAVAATARAAPQFSLPAVAATIAGPLPGRKPGRSDAEKGTGMSCRIEVSYGEVLDKISILEIKAARIADEARQANVAHELERLRASWTAASPRDAEPLVADARAALKAVNEQLWDIEDRIRLKEKAKRFDDEFIELARSVYITNDERARLKREIDRLLGSSIVEEKSYQPY